MSTQDLIRPRRPARHPSARRWWAARIARLLVPASAAVDGFVSTEVAVWLPGGRLAWPEVALACREPPADGRLDRPPELVVTLTAGPRGAAEAARWLEAGARAVWCVGDAAVVQHTADDGPQARGPGEWATVPGLEAVRLPVQALLASR